MDISFNQGTWLAYRKHPTPLVSHLIQKKFENKVDDTLIASFFFKLRQGAPKLQLRFQEITFFFFWAQ